MKHLLRIVRGFILFSVFFVPVNIFSCGVWIEPTFVLKNRPDIPQQPFTDGKLGILRPGFDRRYLVIAYRYLQQRPLTAEERESFKGPVVLPPDTPYDPDPPVTAWLKARSQALGLKDVQKIDIQRYKFLGFSGYPNCGDDAFNTASRTALSRARTFGVGTPLMRHWVAGQDAVFENCGSAEDVKFYGQEEKRPAVGLRLPPPVILDNALLKFDRQYQTAAANFYWGNFDAAASDFEQISQEPNSPWSKQAPYLVARSYIRKATLGATDDSTLSPDLMRQAEERLQAILADPSLTTMHPAARSLLDYVEVRLHPEQALHRLSTMLGTNAGAAFERKLFDYTYLLDHILQSTESLEENPAGQAKVRNIDQWRSAAQKSGGFDDLTDWVLTYQLTDERAREYSFNRWQETKSLPWLLSTLVAVGPDDPNLTEVTRAAAAIGPNSPAYDTALYHRVRLLLEQDQHEKARKLLDANLARIEKSSPSERNAFLAQRFSLVTSFQDFLRFAPRTPVELIDNIGKHSYTCMAGTCGGYGNVPPIPPPPRLELDSVNIFNQWLPLNMLVKAVRGTTLPADLRYELAARTWLRAAILDDLAVARELEPLVLAKYPEWRGSIEQYDSADSPEARRFALVFMLMQFPGMQPFVSAGALGSVINPAFSSGAAWWCYDVGQSQPRSSYETVWYSPNLHGMQSNGPDGVPPSVPAPSWLTAVERRIGEQEWRELSTIGAAPVYFAPVVLNWAKAHPDDPRVPEALHYFVRSTRYGCVDKSIGPYSKQAFQLLHRRYPESEWTKKTKYWFG